MLTLATNPSVMSFFNPPPLAKGRVQRADELMRRRRSQENDAWYFLTTGLSRGRPSYGKTWDRDYNPAPEKGCAPQDREMYAHTGIGALFGMEGSGKFIWELAGWNIIPSRLEQRRMKK